MEMWIRHRAFPRGMPVVNDDLMLFVIENPVLVKRTGDLVLRSPADVWYTLGRELVCETKKQIPLSTMR